MGKSRFFYSLTALILSILIFALCGCEDGAVSSSSGELTTSKTEISSENSSVVSEEAPSSKKEESSSSSKVINQPSKPKDTTSKTQKPNTSKPLKPNTVINKRGNSQGNFNNGAMAAIQGDWIYYSTYTAFYKMKTDGSQNQKIYDDDVWGINVCGDWLYFTAGGDDYFRMKTDGTQRKMILKNVRNFAVVNQKIYYTDVETGYLYRIDENGANKTLIIAEDCDYRLAITENGIYWGDLDLYTADLNGKNIKCHKDFYPQGMIVEGNRIYTSGTLRVSDTNGKLINQYFKGTGGIMDINYSNGWIYYIYAEDNDCVYRIKPDGTSMQKLNNHSSININVVGDWIFYAYTDKEYHDDYSWNEWQTDLYKMKIDGSQNQKISDYEDIDFDW